MQSTGNNVQKLHKLKNIRTGKFSKLYYSFYKQMRYTETIDICNKIKNKRHSYLIEGITSYKKDTVHLKFPLNVKENHIRSIERFDTRSVRLTLRNYTTTTERAEYILFLTRLFRESTRTF